eukprot:gene1755-2907_t
MSKRCSTSLSRVFPEPLRHASAPIDVTPGLTGSDPALLSPALAVYPPLAKFHLVWRSSHSRTAPHPRTAAQGEICSDGVTNLGGAGCDPAGNPAAAAPGFCSCGFRNHLALPTDLPPGTGFPRCTRTPNFADRDASLTETCATSPCTQADFEDGGACCPGTSTAAPTASATVSTATGTGTSTPTSTATDTLSTSSPTSTATLSTVTPTATLTRTTTVTVGVLVS